MNNYLLDVQKFDKTNREGHAAKLYFTTLFGKEFIRNRNNDDKTNSYLNYGYSILLSFIARFICSKGLDNRIGIFHKSFNNNFPLACDLMEPFRFWIDRIVFNILYKEPNATFQDFKETLFKSFNQYIKYENKNLKFLKYIEISISKLLNLDESDIEID
ncbi:type II CRISPR-associated endonuclease Cas1 [Metamycoplasma alkalescens]|uniref:type II CRISPR-associated endonuclease Cas1 n=1 Tax=Metamycoplasma alkalescens TaxID=45363 RepID=UPI003D03BF57